MKRTAVTPACLLLLTLVLVSPAAAVPPQPEGASAVFCSIELLWGSLSSYLGFKGPRAAPQNQTAAASVTEPPSYVPIGADASTTEGGTTDRGPGLDPNG